jgi:hypothetical protein
MKEFKETKGISSRKRKEKQGKARNTKRNKAKRRFAVFAERVADLPVG